MSYPEANDLAFVNTEVNALPYVSDAHRYKSADFWARIDKEGGDCEDFAIGKLNRLIERGWPIEALRLGCCYAETGEYHAVLEVKQADGKVRVLDNRYPWPMPLKDLHDEGYRLDEIQAHGGARFEWCEWKWGVSNG